MATFEPRDPAYAERIQASFAAQGAMQAFGVEIADLAPGYCELRMPWRRELTQQDGFLHAGVITAVADSAGGYAAYSLMPADSRVLTVELKINMLAPADGELLIARGRVVRSGRTLSIAQADVEIVKQGAAKPCATLLETLMCLQG